VLLREPEEKEAKFFVILKDIARKFEKRQTELNYLNVF